MPMLTADSKPKAEAKPEDTEQAEPSGEAEAEPDEATEPATEPEATERKSKRSRKKEPVAVA